MYVIPTYLLYGSTSVLLVVNNCFGSFPNGTHICHPLRCSSKLDNLSISFSLFRPPPQHPILLLQSVLIG